MKVNGKIQGFCFSHVGPIRVLSVDYIYVYWLVCKGWNKLWLLEEILANSETYCYNQEKFLKSVEWHHSNSVKGLKTAWQ